MRSFGKFVAIVGLAAALASPVALRAAPNPSQNGYPNNQDLTNPVVNNVARTPATVTGEPATGNVDWRGVVCTFLVSLSSGSGTETWSIEGYDAATAAWYQIATTAALAFNPYTAATPKTLTVYPGVATGSLSTGNVAQSAVLPKRWRLKDVVANVSGSPAITSKAGCNYIN